MIPAYKKFYPFKITKQDDFEARVVISRDNKCVTENTLFASISLPCVTDGEWKWFNGYVAFHKDEIHREFHLSGQRKALQLLNVHGGISYSDIIIEDAVGHRKTKNEYRRRLRKLEKQFLNRELHEPAITEFTEAKANVDDWYDDELLKLHYNWVIFGFDCNHAMDMQNPIKDPEFVFKMVVQMEQQIKELSDIWDEFKTYSAEIQRTLLFKIRDKGEIDTPFGMSGLLTFLNDEDNLSYHF